ncbi:MAG TPA: 5'/3'-nucleotidase SurE [bacterium]|jgi:5'-nucleotidase|nr:5'/3'-nucleotidase SurE [bacterium]
MRIFLTNDDGVYSEGLKVLWKHLKKLGEISVVVPENEKSAVAHAINLFSPLKIRHIKVEGKFDAYIVNGTPVDCVKIGVSSILKYKPDFLISGINPGANIGMDVLYSGTVSAAAEGAILGIPSIAVSIDAYKNFDFDTAASITVRIIKKIRETGLPADTILNINIPNCGKEMIKGVRATYQSESRFEEEYEERQDPRGNSYFWLKGFFREAGSEKGSDVDALKNRYVSVTPLNLNLTDHRFLARLKKDKFENVKIK